jgi:hypothetical protein
MGATSARERAIADWLFGSGTPATWYLGLSTTSPADDGTGFSEPVGFAYNRVAIPNTAVSWAAAITASDGTTRKENAAKFTFPNPTGSWGSVVAWGLFLAASGGTPEVHQLLDAPITPKNGNTPVEFDIGQLWIIVD